MFADQSGGYPVLAIPVEKKSQFACPDDHVQALANVIPEVNKIITIGWRVSEEHFLAMLKNRLNGLSGDVDLMVVSGTEDGMRGTANSLAIGPPDSKLKRSLSPKGFTGLISKISELEDFLA